MLCSQVAQALRAELEEGRTAESRFKRDAEGVAALQEQLRLERERYVRCVGALRGSVAWERCVGALRGSVAWERCVGACT
jgi:hypothetical protein